MNRTKESYTPYFQVLRFTVAIVVITFIVWATSLLQQGDTTLALVIYGLAGLILVVGASYIYRQSNRVRQGEVLQDEMSMSIIYKAGYWAFTASVVMWTFLISFIEDIEPVRYGIYLGLLGMFVIFGISYLVVRNTAYR